MFKKLFILSAIWFSLIASVVAQSPVDKLFDKYSGKEGYTTVYISKYMFDMFRTRNVNDPKTQEDLDKVVSRLDGIRILARDTDPANKTASVNFYKDLIKELPVQNYKELMVIKEKDKDVVFLIRENAGRIAELLLVVGSSSENVMISITGDIDLKTISKISQSMKIEGMENLDKISKP